MKLRTLLVLIALLTTGLAACTYPNTVPNRTAAERESHHSNDDGDEARERQMDESDESANFPEESRSSERPQERPGQEAQPEREPQAQPEPESQDQPEPGPQDQPEPGPQDQPEPGPQDQPEPGPQDQPEPGPQDQPEREAETEVEEEKPEEREEPDVAESEPEEDRPDGELWRWDLDVGQSYQLQYEATTDMEMNAGGEMDGMMGGMEGMADTTDQITVDTEMALQVEDRRSDGRYDLRIPVERLEVRSSSGQSFTVDDLPEEVRVLRAYMTPRGTLEFYERVVVEVTEQGAYGIVKFTEDGSTTTGEATVGAGGMEASSRAEVDPETGRITATHEVRQREQKTRQVEQEQPAQHVDVLPVEILSLLELPEGEVREGDRLEFETPLGVANMNVLEPEQCGARTTCGKLRSRFDLDNDEANQMMEEAAGPDAESQAAMAMNPSVTGAFDATMLFDVDAGKLFNIEGTSESNTDAHGLQIDETTEFELIFYE